MTSRMLVVPIVEGQGEEEAVPALLHRIRQRYFAQTVMQVNPPIRVKAPSFLNDAEYRSRYLKLASAKAREGSGFVLILLDCDGAAGTADCPAQLGPWLLRQAEALSLGAPCMISLAVKEYESWLIASADTLPPSFGLPLNLTAPVNFEHIRGAKEWLSARMTEGYDPIQHQLAMTRRLDPELSASRSASFARLVKKLAHFAAGSPDPSLEVTP